MHSKVSSGLVKLKSLLRSLYFERNHIQRFIYLNWLFYIVLGSTSSLFLCCSMTSQKVLHILFFFRIIPLTFNLKYKISSINLCFFEAILAYPFSIHHIYLLSFLYFLNSLLFPLGCSTGHMFWIKSFDGYLINFLHKLNLSNYNYLALLLCFLLFFIWPFSLSNSFIQEFTEEILKLLYQLLIRVLFRNKNTINNFG